MNHLIQYCTIARIQNEESAAKKQIHAGLPGYTVGFAPRIHRNIKPRGFPSELPARKPAGRLGASPCPAIPSEDRPGYTRSFGYLLVRCRIRYRAKLESDTEPDSKLSRRIGYPRVGYSPLGAGIHPASNQTRGQGTG